MRTILVHLNIEIEDDDDRTPDEIAEGFLKMNDGWGAVEQVGGAVDITDSTGHRLTVCAPLVEEV